MAIPFSSGFNDHEEHEAHEENASPNLCPSELHSFPSSAWGRGGIMKDTSRQPARLPFFFGSDSFSKTTSRKEFPVKALAPSDFSFYGIRDFGKRYIICKCHQISFTVKRRGLNHHQGFILSRNQQVASAPFLIESKNRFMS